MSTIGQTFAMRILAVGFAVIIFAGCSGGPMTTREKGAGIGALGGAAAGGKQPPGNSAITANRILDTNRAFYRARSRG